jgi:hypothetical protein
MRITFDLAIALMRDGRGRHLMQMHTRQGMRWFIVPGGEVSAEVAQALLEHPSVQPSDDGLFPGISQTYQFRPRLRPATGVMRADAYRQKQCQKQRGISHGNA